MLFPRKGTRCLFPQSFNAKLHLTTLKSDGQHAMTDAGNYPSSRRRFTAGASEPSHCGNRIKRRTAVQTALAPGGTPGNVTTTPQNLRSTTSVLKSSSRRLSYSNSRSGNREGKSIPSGQKRFSQQIRQTPSRHRHDTLDSQGHTDVSQLFTRPPLGPRRNQQGQ